MNKIAQTKSNKQMSLSFDRGTLLLTNIVRKELPDVIGSSVWRWDSRVGAWRCAAIHYAVVRKALFSRFGACFSDKVMEPAGISWPKIDLPKLRSEQAEALAAWSQAGCRGQIIMPTGTGKTEVALAAMARTKTATLVVAPVRDLMYQVLLEIVGFWTPEYLAHRRKTLQQFRHHRILIAVPEKSLRDGASTGENVLVYKTVLKLAPLMESLERIRAEK